MRKAIIAVLAVAMILLASCDPAPKASDDEAVTEIVVTPVQGEATLTITWKAPAAGSLESYNIYIDDAEEPVANVDSSAISYTYDASSLTSGKHTITIITVDIDGNEAVGATAEFTYISPADITGLTAVQNEVVYAENVNAGTFISELAPKSITLTWTAPAKTEGLLSYEIRLNDSDPVSLTADKTSYVYSMSDAETGEYTFSVTAVYGESVRSVAEIKAAYDATAPENVTLDDVFAIKSATSENYSLGIKENTPAEDTAYMSFEYTYKEASVITLTTARISGHYFNVGTDDVTIYSADKYGNVSEALVVTSEQIAAMATPEA